jgi:hypothetical protein
LVERVPTIIKHCALAIFKEGGLHAGPVGSFKKALEIARWRLTSYGFLVEGSQTGSIDDILMTPKGMERERQHRRERDRGRKDREFNRYFRWIETSLERKDEKPEDPKTPEEARDRQRQSQAKTKAKM